MSDLPAQYTTADDGAVYLRDGEELVRLRFGTPPADTTVDGADLADTASWVQSSTSDGQVSYVTGRGDTAAWKPKPSPIELRTMLGQIRSTMRDTETPPVCWRCDGGRLEDGDGDTCHACRGTGINADPGPDLGVERHPRARPDGGSEA